MRVFITGKKQRYPMSKTQEQKKKEWTKPSFRDVPIFFECTYYAGVEDPITKYA
jgi:coenzyme PQQ precursor peptide PqqA